MTAGEPRSSAVSVITIFFDGERFLEEAVESVREQTFRDWELLLVDDGSSDRSPKIARAAAAGDPRIRCLTAPDGPEPRDERGAQPRACSRTCPARGVP